MAEESNSKKKIPQRRCVGCGERKDKRELIRVVRQPNGSVEVDLTGKIAGRGAYLCHNAGCLKKAVKAKRLGTNLECEISEEVLSKLEEALKTNDPNTEK